MSCPFNSRDARHKSFFGACPAGGKIRFSILVPRSFSCSGASFVVRIDGHEPKKFNLYWNGTTNNETEEW